MRPQSRRARTGRTASRVTRGGCGGPDRPTAWSRSWPTAHVAVEPETGLVTDCALTRASGTDDHEAVVGLELLESEGESVTVLADAAYGTGDARAASPKPATTRSSNRCGCAPRCLAGAHRRLHHQPHRRHGDLPGRAHRHHPPQPQRSLRTTLPHLPNVVQDRVVVDRLDALLLAPRLGKHMVDIHGVVEPGSTRLQVVRPRGRPSHRARRPEPLGRCARWSGVSVCRGGVP